MGGASHHMNYGDIRMTAEILHRVPNPLKLLLFEDSSEYTKTFLPSKHYCREQLYEGPGS